MQRGKQIPSLSMPKQHMQSLALKYWKEIKIIFISSYAVKKKDDLLLAHEIGLYSFLKDLL